MTRCAMPSTRGSPEMATTAPLLEIDRLSVRFGATTVVDDVSFDVAPGEKFALVGESGSGKSVTAQAIMGIESRGHTDV